MASEQIPAPQIAVIGAGAIGGVVAAALGDTGHRVRLCVRRRFDRLTRTLQGQVTRYDHILCTEPETVGPVDWVFLCTKVYQIAGAKPWLDRLVGPHTRLAVMQNGVDHIERVAAWAPAERVVPCIVLLPATVAGIGHTVQELPGTIQVPNNAAGVAMQQLFDGQSAAPVQTVEDLTTALWSKLVINCVGGAICSLILRPLGAMGEPALQELASALMREVIAVGRAEGARLDDDLVARNLALFSGVAREHWSSIAQDRREGRPMEWEARNAVVGRIGRRHGIATPLNDAMTALLSVVEPKA